MMGVVITHLFKRFSRRKIELEVEEELRFHLELLKREHIERGMSAAAARDATRVRFGDVEEIKNQCVEISRRSQPLARALKSFFILIFLAGVLVRALGTDIYVRQVGDMLIAVAVLSRMFLYARSLRPSSFLSKNEISSPSILNAVVQTPFEMCDERQRTPIERVISGE